MSILAPFLDRLFRAGEARLTERPGDADRAEATALLRTAFLQYRLDIAGPPIAFDAEAGIAAALYMATACWFATSTDDPPEVVAACLQSLSEPQTPSAALSVDLTLRYAVTIHRRMHARKPEDVLTACLAETLRFCPLSGVLSDVAEPPLGGLLFGGHPGLELLYAERLADHFRPAWLPADGRTRETVELVFRRLHRQWPPE